MPQFEMDHKSTAETKTNSAYIPALRWKGLTPFYDAVLRWVMQEEHFKRELIRQAQIQPGQQVLDLGCGTATLTVMVKQAHPEAVVTGLDGDPEVLQIGRAKAEKAGVALTLDQGMAYELPYPDASFDRVLSSLMFHHLTTPGQAARDQGSVPGVTARRQLFDRRLWPATGALVEVGFSPHGPVGRSRG